MMQPFKRFLGPWLCAFCLLMPGLGNTQNSGPTRADYLTLARSGWVFDLHSARSRRDVDLPPVRFDSLEVAKGEICLFGDPPHALARQVVVRFTTLLREVFDRRIAVTFAGREIANCPEQQRVYIRLYSGRPPSSLFNADIRKLNQTYDIRLPNGWREPIRSPAQTVGYFGRNGAVAHLLINQPPLRDLTPLEQDYYKSILVEEMFQAVSFGADILKFDRQTPFYSKLQEVPVNLRYVPWQSEQFMSGLLGSNPSGLCGFDIFMLHALAAAHLETVNSIALLEYIDQNFDDLRDLSRQTMTRPDLHMLFDDTCEAIPG
ncbi:hypothetical protein [Yoonia sediminilitoris]|uniref:Uncharacterized protein n=1 Tax=Yoonia sediminilitoris TaxID=1286148 RepID=A0A2T6KS83_9RHOB|nr:hypothetical protein [Yoonia sediminilitoris]PUB19424.1 hypothetical protein C8N45_1011022 [Yoonia sediminilitoris]RCW99592.1 hypothetical protein DFP92_1011022 [Yoonia sediminilitoris]